MTKLIRRVVTTHDDAGASVVHSDMNIPLPPFPGADAELAVVWTTGSVPADNASDLEGDQRPEGITLTGGSVFRVTELGPGFSSPMHRTYSIDYLTVLSGELELILDGGETIHLSAGDVVIQRGTNHIWRNPSSETRCRFLVSMIEAQPILFQGEILEKTPV